MGGPPEIVLHPICPYLYLWRHSSGAGSAGTTKGEPWRTGSKHTEVPSNAVAAFIGFAAQAEPVRFESSGASALHITSFGFNPVDATKTQEI